jgi:hypothetical protein
VIVGSLVASPACGLLLDLDHGSPLGDDASVDAGIDVFSVESGSEPPEAAAADVFVADAPPEATLPVEASPGFDAAPDAPGQCVPDPAWCDTHCGTGPDNCGESRACSADCGQGSACGDAGACACQQDPNWCTARCGATVDNCNQPIDCGACMVDAGCVAQPDDQACGARQCGQATNNCGQLVNCGLFGVCPDPLTQRCQTSGTCCTPNTGGACGNQCGTSVTDGCGNQQSCPSSCGNGRVCFQQTCCTPVNPCNGACGVTMTDNCGRSVQCGCSGSQECAPTSTCCTPKGCSASCVDSCGSPSSACCIDAGPEAGADAGPDAAPEAGAPEASAPEASAPEASAPGGDDASGESDGTGGGSVGE